jgi:hypothetical protein
MNPGASPRRVRRILLLLGVCWMVLSTAWVARRWWAVRILDKHPYFNPSSYRWHLGYESQDEFGDVHLWVKLLPTSYIEGLSFDGDATIDPKLGWAVRVCGRVQYLDFHVKQNFSSEPPAVDSAKYMDFVEKIGPLPELEELGIEEVDLQDAELASVLERYPRLQVLRLFMTPNTGAKFPKMERLETCIVYDAAISDEGLAAILRCPALKSLQIYRGRVTKAGLLRIPQFRRPALREVKMEALPLTRQEALEVMQAIQAACPDLQIEMEGEYASEDEAEEMDAEQMAKEHE